MDKVKITQDQATAVNAALLTEKGDKDKILRMKSRGNCNWYNDAKPLNNMDLALLAKALYIGFEVKEVFKPGDRVVRVDGGLFSTGKIILEIKGGVDRREDFPEYRHATAEEIYWLETLGREYVGEFKLNDIFVNGNGEPELLAGTSPIDQYPTIEDAEGWYEIGYFKGLYPAESFAPFEKEVKNNG